MVVYEPPPVFHLQQAGLLCPAESPGYMRFDPTTSDSSCGGFPVLNQIYNNKPAAGFTKSEP